ncbi:MAG: R3H domain-containing nucleic acid-binding protein [Pseudomonadota bacterium]
MSVTHIQNDDLFLLIAALPAAIQERLQELPASDLVEVVLDLGRVPEARFVEGGQRLGDQPVGREDLDHVIAHLGEFSADNRAGIERTLHRISAIRNRKGDVVGLTLRVGRAVSGTIDLIRDVIESGANVLMVGRPGVGKTTKLREIARTLADDLGRRVMVIDTSNEIAGDGDIPHPAIGSARRMQVGHPDRQHAVMIEAVENHMPQVIIVDEIGTAAEAAAARTIAERGVQLIATAHGNTLENLVMNPTLSDLVGGVQTVTLGDDEARFRGTQKTISERKGPPTFEVVVEIVARDELIVHADTAAAVDQLLRGRAPSGEQRGGGTVSAERAFERRPEKKLAEAPRTTLPAPAAGTVRIYPYAISRDQVERVLRDLRLDARTVPHPDGADMIVALRARGDDPRLQQLVRATGIPLHLVKKNTTAQISRLLREVFHQFPDLEEDEAREALLEAEEGIRRALEEGVVVELAPRSSALRQLQHKLVVQHRMVAESFGSEPQRRLAIYPSE